MSLLERSFYGNSWESWLVAVAITAATFVGLWLVGRLVRGRMSKLAARTATGLDDMVVHVLGATKRLFYIVLALYAAALSLALPDSIATLLDRFVVIALVIQGGVWASAALDSSNTKRTSTGLATVRMTTGN